MAVPNGEQAIRALQNLASAASLAGGSMAKLVPFTRSVGMSVRQIERFTKLCGASGPVQADRHTFITKVARD